MSDPASDVQWTELKRPPSRGPGSGKDAWVAYAQETARGNAQMQELLDRQSAVIRRLEAEVERLRAGRPKGGRPPLAEAKVAAIRADLDAGLSMRKAAKRNGVSPMAVSRIARPL